MIRNTFIIRTMDFPPNITMTKRSLLRWFALSFGLISERESRSTILDVLDALFYFQITEGIEPTTNSLQSFLKEKNKEISDKLLRYHLKRLIDVGFIKRKKLRYFFANSPYAEKQDLKAGFNHNISTPINKSLSDIENALEKLAKSYKQ